MLTSFPYTQPALPQLLTVASFIYLLNAFRVLGDHILHAGIIAELFLGVIYGAPLAGILPQNWEATFNVLGYLGLVCIAFEGGLSTNLPVLLSNLPLSCLCALTGITVPIALSFALLTAGFGYRPLEAFAAGAALSSTSLGTTLAALSGAEASNRHENWKQANSDLVHVENMHDMTDTVRREDPSNDAESRSPPDGQGVRELAESRRRKSFTNIPPDDTPSPAGRQKPLKQTRIGTILISAAVIDDVVGLVIAALIPALADLQDWTYPGRRRADIAWMLARPVVASLLISVLTPICVCFIIRPLFWFHGVGERWCAPRRRDKGWGWNTDSASEGASSRTEPSWGTEAHADAVKLGLMVCVLSGFVAIAYCEFGQQYAYIAGLTLSYISVPEDATDIHSERLDEERKRALCFELAYTRTVGPLQQHLLAPLFFASIGYAIPFISLWNPTILWRGLLYALLMCIGKLVVGIPILLWSVCPLVYHNLNKSWRVYLRRDIPPHLPSTLRETGFRATIYPAAFMGTAMVSRGEIGLLIAQIARQSTGAGVLLDEKSFLLCVWAILVCTVVGPIALSVMVRHWRREITNGAWS